MKLRYFLLFVVFLVLGVNHVFSQGKAIEITVLCAEKEGAEYKPLVLTEVYGFYDKKKAEEFRVKAKDIAFQPRIGQDYDCGTKTDGEGICELILPSTGCIVVRPSFNELPLEEVNGRYKFEVKFVHSGKVLDAVDVSGNKLKRNQPLTPIRIGKRKIVPIRFYLFPNETRDDSRMGLAPVSTILETGDTFRIIRPFIKDGRHYHRTQKRRMGFDEKNDPLIAYRTPTFMKTRELDVIEDTIVLDSLKKDTHYKVTATRWFENYHTVYVSDSVCLDEGYDKEPMRFLEYDLVQVPIQRDRYIRKGRREMLQDSRKLNLNFMVGRAELDPADSLNFLQLDQLKEDLGRYLNDTDAGISDMEIHGQASPDGGIAINQRLCRERAEYLKSEISSVYPSLRSSMKASASVAGWSDVADLLEADSLTEYAQEVRNIVAENTNPQVQERKVRALPYYELIKERILPRLRVVDFTFTYFTNRIRTPEEVYELYQTDPGYKSGKKEKPYEFYHLFNMIDDPKELEVLAKEALKSVKDDDHEKPWPLAAYILQQCYLKRDTFDTNLLKPYLDWSRVGYKPIELFNEGFEGRGRGWVNDEAIVTAHIISLCKDGDYYMADSVAINLLPNEARFEKMKNFIRCLNGLWNDPTVRNAVAATSPVNKAVVYAAQDDPNPYARAKQFNESALLMLTKDTVNFDPEDPKVLYMIASLRFRLYANKTQKSYNDSNFEFQDDPYFTPHPDNPFIDDGGWPRDDWGYPMVQCCLKDRKYLKYMLYDGEFNEAYRKAFKAYWKNLTGEEIDDKNNVVKKETDETTIQ